MWIISHHTPLVGTCLLPTYGRSWKCQILSQARSKVGCQHGTWDRPSWPPPDFKAGTISAKKQAQWRSHLEDVCSGSSHEGGTPWCGSSSPEVQHSMVVAAVSSPERLWHEFGSGFGWCLVFLPLSHLLTLVRPPSLILCQVPISFNTLLLYWNQPEFDSIDCRKEFD